MVFCGYEIYMSIFRTYDKAISIERLIRTLFARDKYTPFKLIVLYEETQLGLDGQRLDFLNIFIRSYLS